MSGLTICHFWFHHHYWVYFLPNSYHSKYILTVISYPNKKLNKFKTYLSRTKKSRLINRQPGQIEYQSAWAICVVGMINKALLSGIEFCRLISRWTFVHDCGLFMVGHLSTSRTRVIGARDSTRAVEYSAVMKNRYFENSGYLPQHT